MTIITEQQPDITEVLTTLESSYGTTTEQIESIQVVQQQYSTEYQLVTEVEGTVQTITVVKKDSEIQVLGIEDITTVVQESQETEESTGEGE